MGKVAVVTGANSGVGWETAKCLAQASVHVVLACRNRERGRHAVERIQRETPDASSELMLLDLASLAGVASFVAGYRARFDRLDILINNAGVMFPPKSTTNEGFELQFGVNHLGHFALTAGLFSTLRQTPGFRVVTVTSEFHWLAQFDLDDVRAERGYNRAASYALSKLCNLLFAFEFARRLRVDACDGMSLAAHPGLARSNLAAHSFVTRLATATFGQSAKSGALPVLHAATHPKVRSGEFYGPRLTGWGSPGKSIASPAARNPEYGAKLWRLSEQLSGVSFGIGESATT